MLKNGNKLVNVRCEPYFSGFTSGVKGRPSFPLVFNPEYLNLYDVKNIEATPFLSSLNLESKRRLYRYRLARIRDFVVKNARRPMRFLVCDSPFQYVNRDIRACFRRFNLYLTKNNIEYIAVFEFGKKSGYFHAHYLVAYDEFVNYSEIISVWRRIVSPYFFKVRNEFVKAYARFEELYKETRAYALDALKAFESGRVPDFRVVGGCSQLSKYCAKSLIDYMNKHDRSDLRFPPGFRTMVCSKGMLKDDIIKGIHSFFSSSRPCTKVVSGCGVVYVPVLARDIRRFFLEAFSSFKLGDKIDLLLRKTIEQKETGVESVFSSICEYFVKLTSAGRRNLVNIDKFQYSSLLALLCVSQCPEEYCLEAYDLEKDDYFRSSFGRLIKNSFQNINLSRFKNLYESK